MRQNQFDGAAQIPVQAESRPRHGIRLDLHGFLSRLNPQ
jgi:hypothetical protein